MDAVITPHEPPAERTTSRRKTLLGRLVIGGGTLVVLAAVVLQLVGVSSYWIPSGSMEPAIPQDSRIITWSLGDIDRGDIIVYDKPESVPGSARDLLHRAIGLGGETISFRDGQVYIDGLLLVEPYLPQNTETLARIGELEEVRIPEGHVFVLGDNRSRSSDSRFFGTIDASTVSANHVFIWRAGD